MSLEQQKPHDPRIHVLEIVGNAIAGGMERYVASLVARLPAERMSVSALVPFESAFTRTLRAHGVAVHVAPIGKPLTDQLSWDAIQVAATLTRTTGVDVIHAHLTNAHVLAATVGRLTGKPVLATIHGRMPDIADLEAHRLGGTHMSLVCRYAQLRAMAMGATAEQLHVIPNGVDVERFRPGHDGTALRAQAGAGEGVPLFGFVGRLSYEKGPEVFVRAAALVHAARPDARFVVVGDGPLRAGIEASANRAGLSGRMCFAGHRADVREVYGAIDVAVSTSHSEGMPFAVLEAMASGVPVVATLVGGVPELVEHDVTGFLAADDDHNEMARHMIELADAPTKRRAMAAAARDRTEHLFSLAATSSATADLLAQLARPDHAGDRRIASLATMARPGGAVKSGPDKGRGS